MTPRRAARAPAARSGRSGLTLIELLVSVAILSMLIALLLPGLTAGRAEGTRTKCLANLRSLNQAFTAYSLDDPNDYSTPVHPRAETTWYFDGEYEYGGQTGLGLFTNPDFVAESRPLNRVLFGDAKSADFNLYRCPGDQGVPAAPYTFEPFFTLPQHYGRSIFEITGTSYRLNNHIDFTERTPYKTAFYGPYLRPRTRIAAPAETVLIEETVAEVAKWNDAAFRTPGWHRRDNAFNVGFTDGHAASILLAGQFDLSTADYWILRGDGWRMDCHPEKPIHDKPRRTR